MGKYIISILKNKFDLNATFKFKSVIESDNLLLLLFQHWVQNTHVFLTENDHFDFTTIMLFQFYMGSQPAKFVHVSKGQVSEDPFGLVEETNKNGWSSKRWDKYDNNSHISNDLEDNDNSDINDDSEYNHDFLDSDNNNAITDDDDLFNKDTDKSINQDNSYSSNRINVIMTEDTDDCFLT